MFKGWLGEFEVVRIVDELHKSGLHARVRYQKLKTSSQRGWFFQQKLEPIFMSPAQPVSAAILLQSLKEYVLPRFEILKSLAPIDDLIVWVFESHFSALNTVYINSSIYYYTGQLYGLIE